jgi:hypothetical protein
VHHFFISALTWFLEKRKRVFWKIFVSVFCTGHAGAKSHKPGHTLAG